MHLELNESEYKVSAEGLTFELLPKEFALLRFLYRNKGLTFSREQLLDRVWPLEYPVERTVDDHIYRLRKKLGGLEGLHITTVRGFGYSLAMQDSSSQKVGSPTLQDLELRETMREVFKKYHQYGQGKSMLTLARQQDVLGFEMDLYYSTYVHFVQGDLAWLLNTNEVPIEERVYWLLLLSVIVIEDPRKNLEYCEHALQKQILSPTQHREMEILNIVDFYTLAGEPKKALERLKTTYQVIEEPGFENFFLPTAITEMYTHLMVGTQDPELDDMARVIEYQLFKKPYLREIGSYKVVKGLRAMRGKEWCEAESLLDEGLKVLETSGFVPLRLHSLLRISHYCLRFPSQEALQLKYAKLLEEGQEQLGLKQLMKPLEFTLIHILNIL